MDEQDVVVHRCPPEGSGLLPCCGVTPFEVLHDRMTVDESLVTCTGVDRSRPLTVVIR